MCFDNKCALIRDACVKKYEKKAISKSSKSSINFSQFTFLFPPTDCRSEFNTPTHFPVNIATIQTNCPRRLTIVGTAGAYNGELSCKWAEFQDVTHYQGLKTRSHRLTESRNLLEYVSSYSGQLTVRSRSCVFCACVYVSVRDDLNHFCCHPRASSLR